MVGVCYRFGRIDDGDANIAEIRYVDEGAHWVHRYTFMPAAHLYTCHAWPAGEHLVGGGVDDFDDGRSRYIRVGSRLGRCYAPPEKYECHEQAQRAEASAVDFCQAIPGMGDGH